MKFVKLPSWLAVSTICVTTIFVATVIVTAVAIICQAMRTAFYLVIADMILAVITIIVWVATMQYAHFRGGSPFP